MDDAGFRRGELSRHARRLPAHPDPIFIVTDFVDRLLYQYSAGPEVAHFSMDRVRRHLGLLPGSGVISGGFSFRTGRGRWQAPGPDRR